MWSISDGGGLQQPPLPNIRVDVFSQRVNEKILEERKLNESVQVRNRHIWLGIHTWIRKDTRSFLGLSSEPAFTFLFFASNWTSFLFQVFAQEIKCLHQFGSTLQQILEKMRHCQNFLECLKSVL